MNAQDTQVTRQHLIEVVEKYLEPYQPQDYRLRVIPEGIKQDEDYWYVVVQPTREDVRSYDYFGRLADAENDIEDHEELKILLVPILPG